MGSGPLPKEVDSTIVERHERKGFRVGVAEMNGWRNNMEDAHLVHICGDWGFFGVFDGHGGEKCAKFVAPRLEKELRDKGCPPDDDAVRKILFEVDQEFLDMEENSGSTATMCIVHKPKDPGSPHKLRVINAGDSRVLLGKINGHIVDGGGTDKGLTTDHKPDNEDEKERIIRCGGTVELALGGILRVNGDLAVCRGFGDRTFKQTGGPGPEDRPVTVDPELKRFDCNDTDFILLVCDGVSEGNFSNEEVVKLVSEELAKTKDPGAAARAVCHKAVATNSKDNISCMVVTLDGEKDVEKQIEFRSGSTLNLSEKKYYEAYKAMAERADLTVADAIENRYKMLTTLLKSESSLTISDVKQALGSCGDSEDGPPDLTDYKKELEAMGEPDSEERKEFLEKLENGGLGNANQMEDPMELLKRITNLSDGSDKGAGKGGKGGYDSMDDL